MFQACIDDTNTAPYKSGNVARKKKKINGAVLPDSVTMYSLSELKGTVTVMETKILCF
jgi:hypothetical protein